MIENGTETKERGRGLHHVHRNFMLNLSLASGRSFEESASEWMLDYVSRSESVLNCQVCNTRLVEYVMIVNRENRNRVLMGTDCYEKLIRFLSTGKIESSLVPVHLHIKKLRERTSKLLNETVMDWLMEQAMGERIDAGLREAVIHINRFGYPMYIEQAEKLAEYYSNNRRMFVERLVPESRQFRHRMLLPNHITGVEADRVKAMIERMRRIDEDIRNRAEAARIGKGILDKMAEEIHGMIKYGKQGQMLTEEIGVIADEIGNLMRFRMNKKFVKIAEQRIPELRGWIARIKPLTWTRVRSYVSLTGDVYTEDRITGFWLKEVNVRLTGLSRIRSSGVYYSHFSRRNLRLHVTSEPADISDLQIMKFSIPHKSQVGSFVGLNKKLGVVESLEPVSRGTYVILPVKARPNHLMVIAV